MISEMRCKLEREEYWQYSEREAKHRNPKSSLAGRNEVLKHALGFFVHHQTGSHINLRHATKSHLHVVIPANRKELAPKTFKSILFQAELSVKEFHNIQE